MNFGSTFAHSRNEGVYKELTKGEMNKTNSYFLISERLLLRLVYLRGFLYSKHTPHPLYIDYKMKKGGGFFTSLVY